MTIRAFYNENSREAAAWLRELIDLGAITPGTVDDRSVADVIQGDLKNYDRCHFFAGIGGWERALELSSWPTRTPVWTASLPCQPFSQAGARKGTDDHRHLWPVFHNLIAQCRPAVIFGEQVASKDGRAWLAAVRADLEALGYAVGAADLCAAGAGAPHIRQRLYWSAIRLGDTQLHGSSSGRGQLGGAQKEGGLLQPERSSGRAIRLGDAAGKGSERRQGEGSGTRGEPERAGGAGGVGNACGERRQQVRGSTPPNEETHGGARWNRREQDGDNVVSGSSENTGRLADGKIGRRVEIDPISTRGIQGSGAQGSERPERSGPASRVAHADGGNASTEGLQRSGEHRQFEENGDIGNWRRVVWLPCGDGKLRPAPECGIFPLVDGLPRELVRGGDQRLAPDSSPEGRNMRIRGYGNAIVPQVAAIFIDTVVEYLIGIYEQQLEKKA